MKALQSIQINRENAILVIVDVENEFCKPGGKLYSETSARIMSGVISTIHGLAKRVRGAGIPIIYIQSVRTHREPEFTVFGVEPVLKLGTWAVEIVEELKPQKGDIVVQEFSHDPFYKPNLDQVLQELVPDPMWCCAVITGGQVNVCVYHTVMGFHLRNYWTVVPVDSVYYPSDSANQRALEQFSESGPYPNIFLSRSDLIEVSPVPAATRPVPMPAESA
ncbi:Peroxyureidoacrylate/ureidoacrylate amidohydrolase RutB [subsurface metagenome]